MEEVQREQFMFFPGVDVCNLIHIVMPSIFYIITVRAVTGLKRCKTSASSSRVQRWLEIDDMRFQDVVRGTSTVSCSWARGMGASMYLLKMLLWAQISRSSTNLEKRIMVRHGAVMRAVLGVVFVNTCQSCARMNIFNDLFHAAGTWLIVSLLVTFC